MQTRIYTEEELTRLRSMPKRVTNPGARWLEKPKARPAHRQRGYHVSGPQEEEARFEVYQRQNLTDEYDFSCGIAYLPHGRPPLTLAQPPARRNYLSSAYPPRFGAGYGGGEKT